MVLILNGISVFQAVCQKQESLQRIQKPGYR